MLQPSPQQPNKPLTSKSAEVLASVRKKHPEYFPEDFNNLTWASDPSNVMLVLSDDVALFEEKASGQYVGHYFFTSKGRRAIEVARNMLAFLFQETDAKAVSGLTPVDNKPARWMSRRLGFQSLGLLETPNGLCELFFLTKDSTLWDS